MAVVVVETVVPKRGGGAVNLRRCSMRKTNPNKPSNPNQLCPTVWQHRKKIETIRLQSATGQTHLQPVGQALSQEANVVPRGQRVTWLDLSPFLRIPLLELPKRLGGACYLYMILRANLWRKQRNERKTRDRDPCGRSVGAPGGGHPHPNSV